MPSREGLADSLVTVANGAGLKTGALITDMNEPLASAAGNWLEVENAIAFLLGEHRDPRLEAVTLDLCAYGLVLGGMALDYEDGYTRAHVALQSGKAAEIFERMVARLGGPPTLATIRAGNPHTAPIIRDVVLDEAGKVSGIDARAIGMAVVVLGGGRRNPGDKIILRCGV